VTLFVSDRTETTYPIRWLAKRETHL